MKNNPVPSRLGTASSASFEPAEEGDMTRLLRETTAALAVAEDTLRILQKRLRGDGPDEVAQYGDSVFVLEMAEDVCRRSVNLRGIASDLLRLI